MDRAAIDEVICAILRQDGPDGHVDGHEIIADFIVAVQEGRGADWAREYRGMDCGGRS